MATVDSLIAAAESAYADALALSTSAQSRMDSSLGRAEAAVDGLYIPTSWGAYDPPDVTTGALGAPVIPADLADDVRTAFDEAFARLNDDARPQIERYLADFFPDISTALTGGAEQWLQEVITTGAYVPPEVENAIWNKARDREVAEAQRAEQSLVDATAARGFDLPTGALVANVAAVQQELAGKLNTINRDIAIKSFEVTDANVRFAVEKTVGLRTSFVGALAQFIQLATQQPGQAIDYAKTVLAAKSGLYDTAVRLYSAQTAADEVRVNATLKNRGLELEWAGEGNKLYTASRELQVRAAQVKADAAMRAATAMAQLASASLQTRNTMINASGAV